ncbi:CHAT domain-containing protein [Nonomuraea angiospora]|uniref:CHAT domain-containing protein n=1 Tax=Nonomuraea angiospora TaxID=46172 RepID=UPI00344EE7CC
MSADRRSTRAPSTSDRRRRRAPRQGRRTGHRQSSRTDAPRWAPIGTDDLWGSMIEIATDTVAAVAARLGATAQVGERVTRQAFAEAVSHADIVHFAGHARFDETDARASGLERAGGEMPAARPSPPIGAHGPHAQRERDGEQLPRTRRLKRP